MKNLFKSMRNGLAGLLTLSLLGAPQMLSAREGWKQDSGASRYDNRSASHDDNRGASNYDNRGAQYYDSRGAQSYNNRGVPSYYANDNRYGYGQRYDGYRDLGYDRYREHRSAGESAAIIGGSAGAGALFGAIAGGGKGAAIGALIGGIGGLIVDSATRDQHRH